MTILEQIHETLNIIHEETTVLKTIVENCAQRGEQMTPMVIFYKDQNTRQTVTSYQPTDDFIATMGSLSEILHLFPALESYAALTTMPSKILINDQELPCLNIFLFSSVDAWYMALPFTINDDNTVTWYDDDEHIVVNHVDDQEFDDTGKDLVSMMYLYSHLTSTQFTVAEILSYLSTKDVTINFMTDDVPSFYDFSSDESRLIVNA